MARRVTRSLRWAALLLLAVLAYQTWMPVRVPAPWTAAEQARLASLWLGNLPPLPSDPTNAVADDPQAAAFGHQLFFDTRLSANGAISCATCHQPIRHFTDGLPRGVAIGISKRNFFASTAQL